MASMTHADGRAAETFPTKVDAWARPFLVLALVSGPASVLGGALLFGSDRLGGAVLIATGALLSLLLVLCWPVDYTLTGDALVVRFGRVRWTIPYAEITEVHPTRNIVSSPAWSLDRLWVRAAARSAIISPREKEAFLRALAARDPGLELREGKLQRTSAAPSHL